MIDSFRISDTLKLLRLSGTLEPDDVTVLLTAPTGVAAFNINGMTLQSAFLLGRNKYSGFQPLNHDRLNTLRSKLCRLALVIIDEVSMVNSLTTILFDNLLVIRCDSKANQSNKTKQKPKAGVSSTKAKVAKYIYIYIYIAKSAGHFISIN